MATNGPMPAPVIVAGERVWITRPAHPASGLTGIVLAVYPETLRVCVKLDRKWLKGGGASRREVQHLALGEVERLEAPVRPGEGIR